MSETSRAPEASPSSEEPAPAPRAAPPDRIDPPALTVVIVSHNDARWLGRCLDTLAEHAGAIAVETIVVENGDLAPTRELVQERFPQVRLIETANRGFAAANNVALPKARGRHVLLLNPDTEFVDGSLETLIGVLDARPRLGLVGVRQLDPDGALYPTIRRFPSVCRALSEAVFGERVPFLHAFGERELDRSVYEREAHLDWTSGSFMLVRREVLETVGHLDDRFFMYCEETDLCLRIAAAGWETRHRPDVTIVHEIGSSRVDARREAQAAHSRALYARKHFGAARRVLFMGALLLRYALRALSSRFRSDAQGLAAYRRALRTLLGREEPPFAGLTDSRPG